MCKETRVRHRVGLLVLVCGKNKSGNQLRSVRAERSYDEGDIEGSNVKFLSEEGNGINHRVGEKRNLCELEIKSGRLAYQRSTSKHL